MSGEEKFSARPVFIGWITLLVQSPLQLFLTFWAGGFFGGLSQAFFQAGSRAPFIAFGALAFFGIPIVAYFGKKLNIVGRNIASLAIDWNSRKDFFPSIKRSSTFGT